MNSNRPTTIPPDFTDQAAYQAYLKAEAAGLVRIHGKRTARHEPAPTPAEFADQTTYEAYLRAQEAGLVRIYGEPTDHATAAAAAPMPSVPSAQAQAPVKLAALTARLHCKGEPGSKWWVACDGFLDLEIRKAS